MSNRAGAKDEGIINSKALSSDIRKKPKKAGKIKSDEKQQIHAILYVPKGAEPVDEMTIQVVSINEASFASIAMRRT